MANTMRSEASAMVEINVTPLIDVFLALLVILIIAAPLAMKRLPMPADSHRGGPLQRSIALSILPTGELYLEGKAVTRAQYSATLAAEAMGDKPPTLEICSDAATPYEKVVDALSLARGSGLEAISVKTCTKPS
jgi:biopolymer transport protein ExbD